MNIAGGALLALAMHCTSGYAGGVTVTIQTKPKVSVASQELVHALKYYASQACEVYGEYTKPTALNEEQIQMLADCFLKRDKFATIKTYVARALKQKIMPLRHACTRDLLHFKGETVACSENFKDLGAEAAFHEMTVISEGAPHLRGAGSNAKDYILDPDFRGDVRIEGHGRVFHLTRHRCQSMDKFDGCVIVGP